MKFYGSTRIRRLPNGAEIYVLPRPGSSAMAECCIRTGSIHEGEDLGFGLSHFLEHMLFQGCRDYPGTAAADTLQANGCSVNAYTAYDRTVYHAQGPGEKTGIILKVLTAMIRHPELPEERFAAEREVILREYDLSRDDPLRRLQEELFLRMFAGHPLAVPVIGKKSMIAQVTAEKALAYHARRYTPGRCFWVVTGNVDPDEVFRMLEDLLGDWEESRLEDPCVPAPPLLPGTEAGTDIVFPDTVSRLLIGARLPDCRREDLPPADILFGLLGAGKGSRLTRKFERETGLALSIRSFCFALPGYCGAAGIGATVTPKKMAQLERQLREELAEIASGGLSDAEIEREKNQQYAESLRQLEELEYVSSAIVTGVMGSGTPEAADRYEEQLEETTPARVRETAARILQSDALHVVRQLTSEKRRRRPQRLSGTTPVIRLDDAAGIPLLWLPERTIPLAHAALILPGGTIFEKPGKAGEAKLAAALLSAGTGKHDEETLLAALDQCGADLSVHSGYNSLIISLDAPKKSFRTALELLTEILSGPRFGKREFLREKKRLLEALASRRTAALETAFDRARALLLGAHPYAAGPSGTTESVKALDVSDISRFYCGGLRRSRAVAGFGGDVGEREARDWAEELLSRIPWLEGVPELPPPPVFPRRPSEERIRLDRDQTAVTVSVRGQAYADRFRHYAFMLLSSAENGLSARLFKNVREDNALAYAVGMDMAGGFHPGWFTFYAQTRCDRIDETVALLRDEIGRLGTSGLTGKEFETARESTAFGIGKAYDRIAGGLESSLLEVYYDRQAVPGAEEELRRLGTLSRQAVNEQIVSAFSDAVPVVVCAGKME
ncbi:MAG: insulinase family protein [Lentisphaeria bacterium]|nr:insulinase family protein [Lentisphaeria bacterium]